MQSSWQLVIHIMLASNRGVNAVQLRQIQGKGNMDYARSANRGRWRFKPLK